MENLQFIYPEIFLSLIAMILLMVGVFNDKNEKIVNTILGITAFAITISIYMFFAVDFQSSGEDATIFNGAFEFNDFTIYMKILAGLAAASVCVISLFNTSYSGENKNCFEYPVLIILSLIGAYVLISANDLITVYLGLELLSLSSYVLAALNRDNDLSSEAAIKYFILGALASGLILFGSSLVYGFAGDTNLDIVFSKLAELGSVDENLALVMGVVLVLSGFIFKISAVPMHMWAPDVYSGVSKPILAYLSSVPKVAALAFIIKIVALQPEIFKNSFAMIIIIISILSMVVGAFAGLRQTNIKRLLAYSSISNIGYLLIAVAVANQTAVAGAIFYLAIYIITLIGIFSIISNVNKDDTIEDKIDNFSGMAKTNPYLAVSFAILLFSVAGIPPMAGFFAKFFVFVEAIDSAYYTLAIFGVISSVVACFYYLRVIKVMYFDEPGKVNYVSPQIVSVKILIFISVFFSLTLIFYVDWLLASAKSAALTIF